MRVNTFRENSISQKPCFGYLNIYIGNNNQKTRESLDKFIRFFPDSTFRFYYEMQLGEL